MITILYQSTTQSITGWRHLWAKVVSGFNPEVHCARCLIGKFIKPFGINMDLNQKIAINIEKGQFIYICGVSNPHRWKNNMHLAVFYCKGSKALVSGYNGDLVIIENAKQFVFDDTEAKSIFPEKSAEFLTCRNFQFGVKAFIPNTYNLKCK